MLNKHNDKKFHTELKKFDYICIMEKRNRYTVQIKTEISQTAAYFIDQIVKQAPKTFKSRSDFVRKALLYNMAEYDDKPENYFSKEERNVYGTYCNPNISFTPPPEAIINKSQPVGNSNRKRYTVQVCTELSNMFNIFLKKYMNETYFQFICNEIENNDMIAEKDKKIIIAYNFANIKEVNRSSFLRRVIIYHIVKLIPSALYHLPEKEREGYRIFQKFRI
ncbi:MAG: hypothetical protein GXX03_06700 [Bacteroidales bacterium]|nr:hypothetical protein [Bacteroidales bacterium]